MSAKLKYFSALFKTNLLLTPNLLSESNLVPRPPEWEISWLKTKFGTQLVSKSSEHLHAHTTEALLEPL